MTGVSHDTNLARILNFYVNLVILLAVSKLNYLGDICRINISSDLKPDAPDLSYKRFTVLKMAANIKLNSYWLKFNGIILY